MVLWLDARERMITEMGVVQLMTSHRGRMLPVVAGTSYTKGSVKRGRKHGTSGIS